MVPDLPLGSCQASGKVEVQQKLLDVLAKDNELSARLRQGWLNSTTVISCDRVQFCLSIKITNPKHSKTLFLHMFGACCL